MILIRHEIGDVLRDCRQAQSLTLRQVASRANVALGYLSEVERGQKEASSEILSALAAALDTPVSVILRQAADRVALFEAAAAPDNIPDRVPENLDSFDRFLIGTGSEEQSVNH